MKLYFVISPEYQIYSGDHIDPPEYGCDCIEIEAKDKRDALTLGVKYILENKKYSWAKSNIENAQPPWVGYRAELRNF